MPRIGAPHVIAKGGRHFILGAILPELTAAGELDAVQDTTVYRQSRPDAGDAFTS